MVVDFGRSCYQSKWRFFTGDNSHVEVKGRYYFAAPDTPHLPFKHYFGSSLWHDGNYPFDADLGEVSRSGQKWTDGLPPPDLPKNVSIGTKEQFAKGDSLIVRADGIRNGYLSECFLQPLVDLPWTFASDLLPCRVRRQWALALGYLYLDDFDGAIAAIESLIGPGAVYTRFPSASPWPGCLVIERDGWIAFVADGTRDFQQLALQSVESVEGPVNVGLFSTLPTWYQASDRIIANLVSAGLTANHRVFGCGHSYGAVAALVALARLRLGSPAREIRYITFGAPKIGDRRLVDICTRLVGVDFLNEGDVVGLLPPDTHFSAALITSFSQALIALWNIWKEAPNRIIIRPNGLLIPFEVQAYYRTILVNLLDAVLGGDPVPAIVPHTIGEYYRRISLSCPGSPFPPPQPANNCATAPIGGLGFWEQVAEPIHLQRNLRYGNLGTNNLYLLSFSLPAGPFVYGGLTLDQCPHRPIAIVYCYSDGHWQDGSLLNHPASEQIFFRGFDDAILWSQPLSLSGPVMGKIDLIFQHLLLPDGNFVLKVGEDSGIPIYLAWS